MRYFSSLLLGTSILFSCSVSAMEPEEYKPTIRLVEGLPLNDPQEYYTELGANNKHSALGRKNDLELRALIRNNFTKNETGFYEPYVQRNPNLVPDLRRLSEIFFYDNEVKVLLGEALLADDKKSREGILLFAHALKSEWHERRLIGKDLPPLTSRAMLPLEYYCMRYGCHLQTFVSDLHSPVVDILIFLENHQKQDFSSYIERDPEVLSISGKVSPSLLKTLLGRRLQDSFLTRCTPVLSRLNEVDSDCFDALFLMIDQVFSFDPLQLRKNLSNKLYSSFLRNGKNIPPSLKYSYAEFCLFAEGKPAEAIPYLESLLENQENRDNYFQLPDIYNLLGGCFLETERYEEARTTFEKAMAWKCINPVIKWNLAFSNVKCKNYDDKILKSMHEALETLPMNHGAYNSFVLTYQCVLKEAGKTEELNKSLFSEQEKAIKISLDKAKAKEEDQAKRVKAGIKAQQALSQSTNQPMPQKKTITPTGPISCNFEPPCVTESSSSKGNEEAVAPKKVKKKTKGQAHPAKSVSQSHSEQPKTVRQPVRFIENLTDNKNAWKIFHRLFTLHGRNKNCFDNNVKITLHEVDSLFCALKQDFDSSKGHGSHTKATLEGKMLIFSKTVNLIPEQIIDLRKAFIKTGIMPNDPELIEKLKRDFPDE